MRFIGLEEIHPYKNLYQFKIFEYDDEINLSEKGKYICDLKVFKLDINDSYIKKGFKETYYVLLQNINKDIKLTADEIKKGIQNFIKEEIIDIKDEDVCIFKLDEI
ncbi:hypothetical protein SAMN05661008_00106 [Alkalithermobacter thermoalcaliphilus JW-YL-7 = DSM 7308]|uniref:Uncharacterized protein n=1 Tax=Alkalithermobacter thermoalcaliphilus JW-YL-7 = DSM 7308 TaxID=1121328 RepID=A0A150FTI4_CLOPD|nr:hypothetical protein JWYL7_1415 [[Clostridium] paradoxum JW-YL-7 = DSM 7308]SHK37192.1 hypothetical protein SAMN05661008_00106 [[Clostridium] paradoxum JW-YL-7 = DSM 7308]